ncbi:MAG TPA: PSD1 and planctomycete cytochrome C domain-containing protein, partial [Pirellulales bacterium]|nr:PSD1 and planctomycete cytochrome C domain-containing protein [Pirellulales bacterium]
LIASSAMHVAAGDNATAGAAPAEPSFEKDVRPILKAHCFYCHGEGEQTEGNLDLRLRRLIAQGGDSGTALLEGKPDESLIYQRIKSGEMPPGDKKMSAAEAEKIRVWIAAGAKTARPEPEQITADTIMPEEREFWCFQPVVRTDPPTVRQAERVRTPIDAFIASRLEANGMTFSPEADKQTLIRRTTFDLLGLPPTPEEIAAFVADGSPDAYEKLIDRLLDSPRYGERWGRHWLDLAGYADSDGYTPQDPVRKYAYKYRDYVIQAFNEDKPFDAFIQEQLAGDEMLQPPYKELQPEQIEKLVATGFLRMAPDGTGTGGVDQNEARNQVMAETLKIVSTSLMGLTVGCAQCHNHRYDPIPQSDYYRLRAIFEPAYDWKQWRAPQARLVSLYTDADRQQAAAIEAEAAKVDAERLEKQKEYIAQTYEKELAKLPEEIRDAVRAAHDAPQDKRTPEQSQLLKAHPSVNVTAGSLYLYDRKAADDLKERAKKAADIRATKPVEDFVHALTEPPGHAPATHVFYRGDIGQPKQVVQPGELSVLSAVHSTEIAPNNAELPTTGRRLALAKRLTDGEHPLTARVLVNQFWLHHFGRGIVASPGDFGFLGERPTHPELLDWLASEFVSGGWQLKRLHKLMMTSTTYRQISLRDRERDAIDPDNRLLWRMPVVRLEAEVVRDAIIAVSGKLNDKMFGEPVPVIEDEVGQFVVGIENLNGENRPGEAIPLHGEEFRRSVYVQVRRSRPLAMLDAFDLPAMEPNCDRRSTSTVAPQSLMLMNSEFVVTHASHFAERLLNEAGQEPQAQITRAWQLAFAADPTPEELSAAVAFVAAQAEYFQNNPPAENKTDPKQLALAGWCQALLSANRFLYID